MTIPFSLRGGINWEFVRNFEVAVDVSWWHYQVFQEQVMTLSKPLKILPGSDKPIATPKNFGNSWNVSAGLMVGYQYDTSPIPTATMDVSNLNRGLQTVSVGSRWRITPRWRVGLALMRSWNAPLDIQDSVLSPPTNGKGHGSMFHASADLMYGF